jgi:hypothetical protein
MACSTVAAGDPTKLSWLADGSRLLVDGRWLLRPEDARAVAVDCGGVCAGKEIALSPGGAELLVFDGAALAVAPPEQPAGASVPIPRWIEAQESTPLVNVAFWLAEHVVFVQQYDPADPFAPACRLFDTRDGAWRPPPGGCLTSEFSQLFKVQAGPGQALLLLSAAEGFQAMELVRYDPESGQSPAEITPIAWESPGPLDARFAPDGRRVFFLTPCLLAAPESPPCENSGSRAAIRLYSWTTPTGELRLLRSGLPPGAAFDPVHGRFAWPRDDRICIGDPSEPTPRCLAMRP